MTALKLDRHIRLAEVVQRYYVDGWSQDEVATHLGTSRSNVSRLLDTARREGVVTFVIDHPMRRHTTLEQKLRDVFGVVEARVIAVPDPSLDLVGREAASWLADFDGRRLAIGWGRTMEAVINNTIVSEPMDIEVMQVGGDLTVAPAASGHELVRRLATALGGRYRFLHAPAVVDDQKTARDLLSDARISTELDLVRHADGVMLGVGIPGAGFADQVLTEFYGRNSPAAVLAARLIGDDGCELAGPLKDRVIALDLDDLRAIPTVVAVAAGADKGRAISAVLRSDVIDILICDQSAAAAALDKSALDKGANHDPA